MEAKNSAGVLAKLTLNGEASTKKIAAFKLQADNFTFSSPTIKIKLEQPAATVPAPVATTAPSAKPVTKTLTLTCVKEKTIKKVTSTNPRCPAGYTKK